VVAQTYLEIYFQLKELETVVIWPFTTHGKDQPNQRDTCY